MPTNTLSDPYDLSNIPEAPEGSSPAKEDAYDLSNIPESPEILPTPTPMPNQAPLPETKEDDPYDLSNIEVPKPGWYNTVVKEEEITSLAKELKVDKSKIELYLDLQFATRQAEANAKSSPQMAIDFIKDVLPGKDLEDPLVLALGTLVTAWEDAAAALPLDKESALATGKQLVGIVEKSVPLVTGIMNTVVGGEDAKVWNATRKLAEKHEGYITQYGIPLASGLVTGGLGLPVVKAAARGSISLAAKLGATSATALNVAGTVGATATGTALTSVGGGLLGAWIAPEGEKWEQAKSGAMWGAAASVIGQVVGAKGSKVLSWMLDTKEGAKGATKQLAQIQEKAAGRVASQKEMEVSLFNRWMDDTLDKATPTQTSAYAKILRVPEKKIATELAGLDGKVFKELDEAVQETYRIEARKVGVSRKIDDHVFTFVDQHIPIFAKNFDKRIDLPGLFSTLRTRGRAEFEQAIAKYDFIPDSLRKKAERAGKDGGFKAQYNVYKEWAEKKVEHYGYTDPAKESILKVLKETKQILGNSQEKLDAQWLSFRTSQEMGAELKKLEASGKLLGGKFGSRFKSAAYHSLPDHVVLDDIARRYGYKDLPRLALALNRKEEMFYNYKNMLIETLEKSFAKDYRTFRKEIGLEDRLFYEFHEAKKSPQKDAIVNAIVARLPTSQHADVTSRLYKLSDQLTDAFEMLRKKSKDDFGFTFNKLENYISHQYTSPEIAVIRVIDEIKAIGDVTKFSFSKKAARFSDLVRSMERLSGMQIMNLKRFNTALEYIKDPGNLGAVSKQLSPSISAAYSRAKGSELPKLIREFNPTVVLDKYVNNTFKGLMMKEEMDQLATFTKRIEALGTKIKSKNKEKYNQALVDADFLMTHLHKRMGGEKGLVEQAIQHIRPRWRKFVKEGSAGLTDEQIKDKLDIPAKSMQAIVSATFSALLVNPKSYIKNMESIVTMVGSEVGGKGDWGKIAAIRSMLEIVKPTKGTPTPFGKFREIAKQLQDDGRLASKVRGEELRTGLDLQWRERTASDKVLNAIETSSKAMLSGFELSEQILRVSTWLTAEKVAERVLKTGDVAEMFSKVVSPGVKDSLISKSTKMLKKQDELKATRNLIQQKALGEELAVLKKEITEEYYDYVAQKSLFIYNNANKSNLLKDVGPLFSMFLRFPSENLGNAMNRLWAGDSQKLFQMMMTPVATSLVYGGGFLAPLYKGGDDRTEAHSMVYPGKSPFALLARQPAVSMKGLVPFSSQKSQLPPIPQLAVDLFSALTGDEKAAGEFVTNIIRNQTGGLVTVPEFILDDVVSRMILAEPKGPVRETLKGDVGEWVRDSYELMKETIFETLDKMKKATSTVRSPSLSSLMQSGSIQEQERRSDTKREILATFKKQMLGEGQETSDKIAAIIDALSGADKIGLDASEETADYVNKHEGSLVPMLIGALMGQRLPSPAKAKVAAEKVLDYTKISWDNPTIKAFVDKLTKTGRYELQVLPSAKGGFDLLSNGDRVLTQGDEGNVRRIMQKMAKDMVSAGFKDVEEVL